MQSRSFLVGLLQFLAKNMALLVQKFVGDFFCQNKFLDILRLKFDLKVESLSEKIKYFIISNKKLYYLIWFHMYHLWYFCCYCILPY